MGYTNRYPEKCQKVMIAVLAVRYDPMKVSKQVANLCCMVREDLSEEINL